MRTVLRFTLVIALAASTSCAGLLQPGAIMEHCPCGPSSIKGPVRLLFPQGCKGADFRDACRKHDQGYATYGYSKEESDSIFLADMLAVCGNSRRPEKAERKARWIYGLVDRFGEGAYKIAQLEGLGLK